MGLWKKLEKTPSWAERREIAQRYLFCVDLSNMIPMGEGLTYRESVPERDPSKIGTVTSIQFSVGSKQELESPMDYRRHFVYILGITTPSDYLIVVNSKNEVFAVLREELESSTLEALSRGEA